MGVTSVRYKGYLKIPPCCNVTQKNCNVTVTVNPKGTKVMDIVNISRRFVEPSQLSVTCNGGSRG